MNTILLFMGSHRRKQVTEIWLERLRWLLYTIWAERNNCVIRFGKFRLEKKMNKKKWIRIVSIYSIIYTVITLLNSVLYLCNGIYEDPSGNWHELDRAMILLIGIAAFELCTNLPVKPLVLRYLIAYIPSQLLAFAYVWFSGLREPLAKTAYRDIWINFTGLFVLLCIINTVVYVFKKKRGQESSCS